MDDCKKENRELVDMDSGEHYVYRNLSLQRFMVIQRVVFYLFAIGDKRIFEMEEEFKVSSLMLTVFCLQLAGAQLLTENCN